MWQLAHGLPPLVYEFDPGRTVLLAAATAASLASFAFTTASAFLTASRSASSRDPSVPPRHDPACLRRAGRAVEGRHP